jgi:UDPglucose 6-dehydrogenase
MGANTLSLIGLGKLGLCMAGVLGEAGYKVMGVDVNQDLINMINAGEVPYKEKDLDRVLNNSRGKLTATSDYREAILNTNLTFIVVATPTQKDGTYGNEQLRASLKSIAEIIKEKDSIHHIVISCTVMPGTIDNEMIPLVEEVSGKKVNDGFTMAYNPEFIAMGDVIRIFTRPDFVLVGESNHEIGEYLEEIYGKICPNDPPVSRMSIINAELAKISLNCFVTTKITYANMLAELCEALPGGDIDVVSKAIGQDERIGSKVLKGGLGFGGPCFPRDNRAFVRLAKDFGVNAELANQTHETNRWQVERLQTWITDKAPKGSIISVLGMAYRSGTPLVEESQALQIAFHLVENGYKVRVHDKFALENTRLEAGDKFEYYDDIQEAIDGADVAVVTMMADEYREITSEIFKAKLSQNGIVFDFWRLYRGQDFSGLKYLPLGIGNIQNPGE